MRSYMTTTLRTILADKVDELADPSIEWRLYVHDHKESILALSSVITLSTDEMNIYEYRPENLLSSRNIPTSLTWIFLWLNGISSAKDFSGYKTVVIPKHDSIRTLRKNYLTYKSELIRTNQYIAEAVI